MEHRAPKRFPGYWWEEDEAPEKKKSRLDYETDGWVRPNVIVRIGDAGDDVPELKRRIDSKAENWTRPNVIVQIRDADDNQSLMDDRSGSENGICCREGEKAADGLGKDELRRKQGEGKPINLEDERRSESGYSSLRLVSIEASDDQDARSSSISSVSDCPISVVGASNCPLSTPYPRPSSEPFPKSALPDAKSIDQTSLAIPVKAIYDAAPIRDDGQPSRVDEFLRRIDAGRELPCLLCAPSFTEYKLLQHICDDHFAQYRPYKCGECDFRTGHLKILQFVHAMEAKHGVGAQKFMICGKRNENVERIIKMMHRRSIDACCSQETRGEFIERLRSCSKGGDAVSERSDPGIGMEIPDGSSSFLRRDVPVHTESAAQNTDLVIRTNDRHRKPVGENPRVAEYETSKPSKRRLSPPEQYLTSISRLRQLCLKSGFLEFEASEGTSASQESENVSTANFEDVQEESEFVPAGRAPTAADLGLLPGEAFESELSKNTDIVSEQAVNCNPEPEVGTIVHIHESLTDNALQNPTAADTELAKESTEDAPFCISENAYPVQEVSTAPPSVVGSVAGGQTAEIILPADSSVAQPIKRGRGRPRKYPPTESKLKKPRGRPRKMGQKKKARQTVSGGVWLY